MRRRLHGDIRKFSGDQEAGGTPALSAGGAAALSTLVTMSPGRLGAVTVSECAQAFPQFSVFIVNFNRARGRGGSDQALLNCLNLIN